MSNKKPRTLYADRDAMQLDIDGNFYSRHVVAMTAEKLHDRGDIAAELGHRDQVISELRRTLSETGFLSNGSPMLCHNAMKHLILGDNKKCVRCGFPIPEGEGR